MNHVSYTESNQRMIMNDEIEGMWKEPVLSCCKILCKYLLVEAEENHQNWIVSQVYNRFREFPN
jgi:hypothetical protein